MALARRGGETPVEVAVGNQAPSFALATLDGSKMVGIALDEGGSKPFNRL